MLLYDPFNWKQMFFGDAGPLYLAEICLRTAIMYIYAIFLIRFLGKRGMGQFSFLELVIIISFGTAVGDPMMLPEVPLINGMVCITVITILQVNVERFINRNRKVEKVVEGKEDVLVKSGHIQLDALARNNISHTDLFRGLRTKEVEHLGQVKLAIFETSGEITVFFHSPKHVRPGLSIIPEEEIPDDRITKEGDVIPATDNYSCYNCGETIAFRAGGRFPSCPDCNCNKWVLSS